MINKAHFIRVDVSHPDCGFMCQHFFPALKNPALQELGFSGSALAYYVKKYKFQAPNYKQISNSNTQ